MLVDLKIRTLSLTTDVQSAATLGSVGLPVTNGTIKKEQSAWRLRFMAKAAFEMLVLIAASLQGVENKD